MCTCAGLRCHSRSQQSIVSVARAVRSSFKTYGWLPPREGNNGFSLKCIVQAYKCTLPGAGPGSALRQMTPINADPLGAGALDPTSLYLSTAQTAALPSTNASASSARTSHRCPSARREAGARQRGQFWSEVGQRWVRGDTGGSGRVGCSPVDVRLALRESARAVVLGFRNKTLDWRAEGVARVVCLGARSRQSCYSSADVSTLMSTTSAGAGGK